MPVEDSSHVVMAAAPSGSVCTGTTKGQSPGGPAQEYADALATLTPNWMYPVLVLSCLIVEILGAILGKTVLKKHFKKADIT